MAMLVEVVERGSMRRAARALGLTPSAVSQQIRQLERETGVTLLRRSTRRLALTDAGEAFYEGCAAMVAATRTAQERLSALQDSVTGELAISAPVGFAGVHLTSALVPLLAAHPTLTLRLVATDDQLDLVKERIDIAIAIGTTPPASTLVRQHLASWPNVLVAAPAYLRARGTPRVAADLASHDFVTLPRWHHPADVLTGPGEPVTGSAPPRASPATTRRPSAARACRVRPVVSRGTGNRRRACRWPPRAGAAGLVASEVERRCPHAAARLAAGQGARGAGGPQGLSGDNRAHAARPPPSTSLA